VWLLRVPKTAIRDYDTAIELDGADAKVSYTVYTQGEATVHVRLLDAEGNLCAESLGSEGVLHVKNAHLWEVRNAYLYQMEITLLSDGQVVDTYTAPLGIRTVAIEGTKILINGKPVYLKGYGKHEDFEVLGRGFNWGVAKRDFECMKWTNANCFRTSHYPYAEEWYQFADREGFLIIDEVPAVGMKRSFFNFFDAGTGKNTHFFETPTVPELLKNHIQAVEEMIVRDKNHPSVIAFSLFNEPETTSAESRDYFTAVFEAARPLDPQHRPLTGAFEKDSSPEACLVYPLCDFICLNRYYGWYVCGGPEIDEAEEQFRSEMDAWAAKNLNVPFVFSEFGTDTMASEHKLPSVMWSQEYQNEYYEMNFGVFDSYDFVQGELTWNFADFQTGEGTMRVNGNKKGVFTRTRQPKESAMILKRRWEGKES
jgi:beta-glucuronidase